jgi:hypothetical protein
MQTSFLRRILAVFLLAALTSCSRIESNPYAAIKNPPVVQARLHTITLATDSAEAAEELQVKGYEQVAFLSNYPVSIAVESTLWSVPEPVVEKADHWRAPAGIGVNVRLLRLPLAANGVAADPAVEMSFYRNVLGSDVPPWPMGVERTAKVRVQVWTFLIPDVRAASKRLRENSIPVVFDPVAITTAYLGDHKTMAIRAPDGTIIELVETAAQ